MTGSIIRAPGAMRNWSRAARDRGKSIAVVPTMGALHAGHLRLVERATELADRVIVTIFVNPTQFGEGEDFERYPRQEESDVALATSKGADIVFCPDASSMYPTGFQTSVRLSRVSRDLCGASRPGHFDGVATVVTKLFNITLPSFAIFGEKDYQQLALIRQLARDLDFDIEIVGVPIVRDDDGLALSSRNRYLSSTERRTALAIPRSLERARQSWLAGVRDPREIARIIRETLATEPTLETEYAEIRDAITLEQPGPSPKGSVVAAVAARVGSTRLIDNIVLTVKE